MVIAAAVVEGVDQAVAMAAVVGAAVVAEALTVPRDHREPATHQGQAPPAGQGVVRKRRQGVLAAAAEEAVVEVDRAAVATVARMS